MTGTNRKKAKDVEAVEILPSPTTPFIFISHDTRDADIAELFSDLLRSASAGMLRSFRSSDRKGAQGIEYGTEWYKELMKNLQSASEVVCLLTQRSLERPWILYEAGVAIGKLETPVLGIALGVPLSRASTGPFAQFQNCADDEESLTKLVMQLVKRIPNADPDREVIKGQVQVFIQKTSQILVQLDSDKDKDTVDETSVAKLFEEVKVMFQDLPSRVEGRLDPYRKRKYGRFHPAMFEEMMHISGKLGDPIGLLMMFSVFRDDVPWLYELGLETYRTIKHGGPEEIEEAVTNLRRAVEFSRLVPFMEGMRDKEMHFAMRELPSIIERFLPEKVELPPKTNKKTDKGANS
jgi:hypothetical protein